MRTKAAEKLAALLMVVALHLAVQLVLEIFVVRSFVIRP